MRYFLLCLLAASSLALAASPPSSGNPSPILPDRSKSPGDVLTTDSSVVCKSGYTKTVRNVPTAVKNLVYESYGITNRNSGEYEIDHIISLELGGSNSIKNLFPESYITQPFNAHTKDALENKLHALVCKGQLELKEAQKAISEDWTAAYVKYLGLLPTSKAPTPPSSVANVPPKLDHKAKCADFSSSTQATAYMVAYGADWLDRDHDGIACEALK